MKFLNIANDETTQLFVQISLICNQAFMKSEQLQGTKTQHKDNIERNIGANTESQQHKHFQNANINTKTNFTTKKSRPQSV